MKKQLHLRRSQRRGSIVALTAVLMIVMLAFVAFSVDMGVAYVERAQLQRTADAAAVSAVVDLLDQQFASPGSEPDLSRATSTAHEFAAINNVSTVRPELLPGDVLVGEFDRSSGTVLPGFGYANAAQINVRRSTDVNGQTRFFFARVMGHSGVTQSASATAAYLSSFRGFTMPSNGENLGILPIALDVDTWNDLQQGVGQDEWTWDSETGEITPGPDEILEINLYPQGVGLPGNRGTVDIGNSGNSTHDIKRQIIDGVSESDLAHHGGKLELDSCGKLDLNGDTGISAGMKEQLASIMGEPRIIPIFSDAAGNGNNANFVITEFCGVRIMEVKLNGKMSSKRVIIQPCAMKTLGGIPSEGKSYTTYVYSPVSLMK